MNFAHPDGLWLLWVLPILGLGRIWADSRSAKVVQSLTAARLRDSLVKGDSGARSWAVFALQLAALAFFTLALCRPQWGEETRELKETGRNILIAIDTSRSMLATDVTPDRLTRAKLAAQDLLFSLKGDRVGLIAFAGQAYLQAPLTTDHEPVMESIQTLDTTSVPAGGSDLTKALRVAIEAVEKSPARSHGLILFSDGGDDASNLQAYAKQAAEKRILVLAVGVGSESGSLIPNPDPSQPGDFIRDGRGNVVQTKLDGRVMQELAAATGGRYLRLGTQSISSGLVSDLLSALDQQQETSREERKPIERFHLPLVLGIVSLMIAWFLRPRLPASRTSIRPAVACFIAFGSLSSQSNASESSSVRTLLGSLFQRTESQSSSEARAAYEGGDLEKARNLYSKLLEKSLPDGERREISYGLGATAHRLQDYDRAVDAFSEALRGGDQDIQVRAHRGIAHTLYDQGDRALAKQPQFTIRAWTDALRHFDASLNLEKDASAKENREFVKKRLDELKKAEEEKKQQQQQKKKGGKKEGDKGDGKEGKEGEEGEQGEKGQQGQKDGQKKGKEGEQGQEGEDVEPKEEKGKGDQGEEEGKEGQGKEALPDGQIAAGQSGEKPQEADPAEEREMAESQRNETTGFSRNEARAFLRTYADDQKAAILRQQRRPAPNGKDW